MTSLQKVLLETFYQLRREFPAEIDFTKVAKSDVDPETGIRDDSGDRTFHLLAVLHPVDYTTEFFAKLLGRVEKIESLFLVRVKDLPPDIKVEIGDYFVYRNVKYRNLRFEDFDGTLIALTGDIAE